MTKVSSPSHPATCQQPSSGWKRLRTLFHMVLPPLLISFLLKSIGIITGGALLFQGMSFLTSNGDGRLSPVIMTLDGPVQGSLAHSRNGSRQYWQYLSIPFAQPPVRELRFQAPVPVTPWKEVRQGLSFPPGCVQFEPIALGMTWGVEDCLYLNVFTPTTSASTRKSKSEKSGIPVLVYIYGGAFLQGQSSFYRPDYLMDQNVVVVTFNYRLGPLGFLNFQEANDTSDKYPRGNMGLKDQNLALKWIQKNIAQFGGDPTRVTILGDSAGAVSVHLHMLSQMSRGLFHRAILFSGSAHSPWGFTKNPRKIATEYGKRLGCPTEDASIMLQCYMGMDPHEMVKLQYSWSDPHHEKDVFVPSVEIVQKKDTFLWKAPSDIIRDGDSTANVPLLAGMTSGDGGLRSGRFRAMPELIPILDQRWEDFLDKVLFLDDPLPPQVAKQLRHYYFVGNESWVNDLVKFYGAMTRLTSDSLFVGPVHRAAVHNARRGNPTYLFYYDYRPAAMVATYSAYSQVSVTDNFVVRWVKLLSGLAWDWGLEHVVGGDGAHRYGVGHAENIFQIFNLCGVSKLLTGLDVDFSARLIQSIVDFAQGSKPLTYRGVAWPQINEAVGSKVDALPYMKLDNSKEGAIMRDPFRERMQVWEKLRSTYPTI